MPKITLKAARVNAGYTQEEAAQKLGVSKKTLWQWESGKTIPKANKVEMLCKLYNIPYGNLIFF